MEESRVCETMARTAKVSLVQQSLRCIVSQRDDICYSFKFKEDAKGQDVMDQVCGRLGIVEKDYFGLQYTNARGEIHWLNMRNRISKQVHKAEPYSLLFCVKFYVPPHQLLQESSRKQFFLNVKHEMFDGKYQMSTETACKLYGLLAQSEAGKFRENHISYNPSRTSPWTPEFRSDVILEHCKLNDMSQEIAEYYYLKEIAELDDYGTEFHNIKSEDNNKSVLFGIGVDCLKIEKDNVIERIPYTCLRMATHSGKTVKIDIYTSEFGDIDSFIYRLNSKEAACALYRSITEHHAFYRCDSIRPAVKEQVAKDFFDTVFSWFHDDNNTEQNYIFDTERTCREAYDHARRILYNFGASTAAAMSLHGHGKEPIEDAIIYEQGVDGKNLLLDQVTELRDELYTLKESFHCPICRDNIVDMVLQCGHLVCSGCSKYCEICPLCRASISEKTRCYLPVNFTTYVDSKAVTSDGETIEDSVLDGGER